MATRRLLRGACAIILTGMRFESYVAIGDSTSEGLDDPDGKGGYRGWADRLAEHLARAQGSVLYANLAVRGRTTRRILDEQLEQALSLRPSLVTAVSGTNDVLRPRFDADAFFRDISTMQRALVDGGAAVLTFTLPDLGRVLPLARPLRRRVEIMNDAIRAACEESGAILCDFARLEVAGDPRLWSGDRLHANSTGHARMAAALAWHLGLPDVDRTWAEPLPEASAASLPNLMRAELAWMRLHLAPWLWRHLLGRSSGDGIAPKRPQLTLLQYHGD